jgi:hypothetical protein
MHPLAFASRFNNSSASKISEMPRYLRLIRPENFHEEAHANLAVPNEVQQAQPSPIGQGAEKQYQVCFVFNHER